MGNNPRCVCDGPGECKKYINPNTNKPRKMIGRLYELCAGINCSLEFSNAHHDSWEKQMGLFNKLGNFAKAATEFITAGMPRVTDEEYEARLLICEQCEHCDKTSEAWQCKLCGCNLKEGTLMPGKARWATQDCPIKKWAPLELNIIKEKSQGCCGRRG